MTLILASRSPRRQQLLATLGVQFQVREADIDETPLSSETPVEMTSRLAAAKAQHVFDNGDNQDWVLGGDTTVALGNKIFGKPYDREEAISMLQTLSGQTHEVISALCLVGASACYDVVVQSKVTFCELDATQISAYCHSDEPFDKAGSYGIQGYGGSFVSHLSGSYSGVVGLPLYQTRLLLAQAGYVCGPAE